MTVTQFRKRPSNSRGRPKLPENIAEDRQFLYLHTLYSLTRYWPEPLGQSTVQLGQATNTSAQNIYQRIQAFKRNPTFKHEARDIEARATAVVQRKLKGRATQRARHKPKRAA